MSIIKVLGERVVKSNYRAYAMNLLLPNTITNRKKMLGLT